MNKDPEDVTLGELMDMVSSGKVDEVAEIMLKYKQKWNKLAQEQKKKGQKIVLRDIILRNKDLSGLDFSNTDLSGGDFSGSTLANAHFQGSTLVGADLSGANLYGANFYGAFLSETDLSRSNLDSTNLNEAYLTGSVNLAESYMKPVSSYQARTNYNSNAYQAVSSDAGKQTQWDNGHNMRNLDSSGMGNYRSGY